VTSLALLVAIVCLPLLNGEIWSFLLFKVAPRTARDAHFLRLKGKDQTVYLLGTIHKDHRTSRFFNERTPRHVPARNDALLAKGGCTMRGMVFAVAGFMLMAPSPRAQAGDESVTALDIRVERSRDRQVIDGFGGSLAYWGFDADLAALRHAFGDLGATIVRIPMAHEFALRLVASGLGSLPIAAPELAYDGDNAGEARRFAPALAGSTAASWPCSARRTAARSPSS